MKKENDNNACSQCSVEIEYLQDSIKQLEDALEDNNAKYMDILNKFRALQEEYNKVCNHRDILFSILDKIL